MEHQTCRVFIEVFKPGLGNGFQQRNTYIVTLTKPRNSSRRMNLPPVHYTNLTHKETCSCVETSVASSPIKPKYSKFITRSFYFSTYHFEHKGIMEHQTCRVFIEVFKPGLGNGFQQRNTYIVRHMS
jgi:hypothetical protein